MRKELAAAGILASATAASVAVLRRWRRRDERAARRAWASIAARRDAPSAVFDPSVVAHLPEAARRYFLFSIEPGTPLPHAIALSLEGELSIGPPRRSFVLAMRARQILAGARGFVWTVRATVGPISIAGTDFYAEGEGASAFWLNAALPLGHANDRADHARSSVGRAIAEAAFWLPSALLPAPNVKWLDGSSDLASVVVTHNGFPHRLDMSIGADGTPLTVTIQRWSRENPERRWQLQPFGGRTNGFRHVGGFTIAAAIEGGNWFGTERYAPFYQARLLDACLL